MANLYAYEGVYLSNLPQSELIVLKNSYVKSLTNTEIWFEGSINGYQASSRYDGYFDYSTEFRLSNSTITAIAGYIGNDPIVSLFNIDLKVWQNDLAVSNRSYVPALYEHIFNGNDEILGDSLNDEIMGYKGSDEIFGFEGNDFIHGNHGKDYLWGGAGDDVIRGGHGHDVIVGGFGSDWIWGGQGSNLVWGGEEGFGADSSEDKIFVPVDSSVNPFGNPSGGNRDMITYIDDRDKIFMHGVDDSSLSFVDGVIDPKGEYSNYSAVGIYANGSLEALVISELNAQQVNDITIGGFFA